MSAPHAIEIAPLRSTGWLATCVCGWIGKVAPDRTEARSEAKVHAPDAPVTEAVPAPPAPAHRAPAVAVGSSTTHRRQQSELVRAADGRLTFRAVCACGWKSRAVDMARVVLLWEDHVEHSHHGADGPT